MAKPPHPLLRRLFHVAVRIRERRAFRHRGCRFTVRDGVVNPTIFLASRVFAEACLRRIPAGGTRVLELGCGSGFTAVLLARAGHAVTAVDVDPLAVLNTKENAAENAVPLRVVESHWDEALPADERFDFVVVNPPFLTEEPPAFRTALYAGPGLERLHEALGAVRRRLADKGRALVLTSDRTGRAAVLEAVRDARLRIVESREDKHWLDTYFTDIVEAA